MQVRVFASDDRICRALSRIAHDPAVTVQELAQLVHLSGSRLGHLFKTQTGVELRQYLVGARLERAAQLLRGTDMQIKEISHVVGYQHVPSFDRIFRKRFNVSPSDYRRRQSQIGASVYGNAGAAYAGSRADSGKG
jgi:AraC-like DNA-binding protein